MDPAFFPPLITGLDYDTTAPVFKELYQNYSQLGTGARLRERSLFLQIAAAVCDLSSPAGKAPSGLFHEKTISESVNYIQEYYTEDISLPLLASHSGCLPNISGSFFKEQTGMGRPGIPDRGTYPERQASALPHGQYTGANCSGYGISG